MSFDPHKDKTQFDTISDFDRAMKEVADAVQRIEKQYGVRNMQVLLAYNCKFGGRVRALETKISYVDEVIQTIKAMADAKDGQAGVEPQR